MKQILTADLKPGMVTASRIYSPKGQFLYEAGSTLTAQMIAHLTYYSIPSVQIAEEPVESRYFRERFRQQYPPAETRAQKIQSSKEYKTFSKKFDQNISSLHSALNDCILRSKELNTKQLLKETLTLFSTHTTTISMFDMLHNLRQIDDSTYAHSINVALISRMIGIWLGYPEEDLDILTLCGMLHDIGKCCISNQIISKPAKLTPEEYSEVQKHTLIGYELLKPMKIDERIKNAALMHHERCDGTGYPMHLKGTNIDDFAAIVSIADVYDAMTANRCYRAGLCPFEVIAQFEHEGLQKYKPQFILTFLNRIANTYINNNVRLNDGTVGEIVFINKRLTRPTIRIGSERFINLEERLDLYVQAII